MDRVVCGMLCRLGTAHAAVCLESGERSMDRSICKLIRNFVSGAEEGQVYTKRGSGKFGGGTSNSRVPVGAGTASWRRLLEAGKARRQ